MGETHRHICPHCLVWFLDDPIRKLIQNPKMILERFVKEGMTVLDVGCGPGVFSVEMAKYVTRSGMVIAADLQEGMLDVVRNKIRGTDAEKIITLHKCNGNRIGISEKVDFVLAFYVVHEVPDKKQFLGEIKALLRHDGAFLIIEPLMHVSKSSFDETLSIASNAGFKNLEGPKVFFSRTALLRK